MDNQERSRMFDRMYGKSDDELLSLFINLDLFPEGVVSSTVVAEAFNQWLISYGLRERVVGPKGFAHTLKRSHRIATWRNGKHGRLNVHLKYRGAEI